MAKQVKLYKFKVKDYTTILYGQKDIENQGTRYESISYYVQRGDGHKYSYDSRVIEWAILISTIDNFDVI